MWGLDVIKSDLLCFDSSDVAAREYQAALCSRYSLVAGVAGLVLGTLPAAGSVTQDCQYWGASC